MVEGESFAPQKGCSILTGDGGLIHVVANTGSSSLSPCDRSRRAIRVARLARSQRSFVVDV